ncbi:hypothetical protein Tco_1385694 [Tanacetum coccineum]
MDDPNITMEEYIQLMADKARGRDQTFNWETTTNDEDLLSENDKVGGVFINLEISKCWSLEISRRLFNIFFAQELNLENHSQAKY